MPVDRLERRQQTLPPLAIKRADRTAQPVHRQPQFLALSGIPDARCFQFGQLGFGDQIDRTDPVTINHQFLVGRRFLARRAHVGAVEPDAFGQQDRGALEAFAR